MRVNPLRAARLRKGLTQAEVAARGKISPMAVLRYEQGLFGKPSEKILGVFDFSREETLALVRDYQVWREEVRTESLGIEWYEPRPVKKLAPFEAWAYQAGLANSRIGICKALCLHPQVLVNYLTGKTKHLPEDLRLALEDIGWHDLDIDDMHSTHREHFRRIRNAKRVA